MFKTNYKIRKFVLDYLFLFLGPTMALALWVGIKVSKLYQYGFSMFPQYNFEGHYTIQAVLKVFWIEVGFAAFILLPFALGLDMILRRTVYARF